MQSTIDQLNQRVEAAREDILKFFREIVAIPSMNSDIEKVGERIGEEMRKLGFDKVYVDKYGSIVGKIGNGPRIILFDSHIDTVGIGDPSQWQWDPFVGKVENGMLYARGALDEKNSTPGMVYGMAIARDLGLLDGYTAYYLGNIEEWCDGVGCAAFSDWEGVVPDFVVIGEPTKMKVYHGHKGRLELEVVCKGKSAHAASNYMGDNAITKMMHLVNAIDKMDATLRTHPFLGQGRITVTRISSVSPSDNAVPDECRIFIDRRVTFGDTVDSVLEEISNAIPEKYRHDFRIDQLVWTEPSHTGAVYAYDKYFPSWALEEDHSLVKAGAETSKALWNTEDVFGQGKWDFSTNGNYWCGKKGIPCIGFGPGDEIYAHNVDEHVPLEEVVQATKFYALLPKMIANNQ
ncbi:MAG TPA: YgeY family selenium metabolism-linked hydrolase [Anaerolineales bacterium]|nr:YgeY family selenium metabolism-linked hydrolase [Anaerolineales bacterium]